MSRKDKSKVYNNDSTVDHIFSVKHHFYSATSCPRLIISVHHLIVLSPFIALKNNLALTLRIINWKLTFTKSNQKYPLHSCFLCCCIIIKDFWLYEILHSLSSPIWLKRSSNLQPSSQFPRNTRDIQYLKCE